MQYTLYTINHFNHIPFGYEQKSDLDWGYSGQISLRFKSHLDWNHWSITENIYIRSVIETHLAHTSSPKPIILHIGLNTVYMLRSTLQLFKSHLCVPWCFFIVLPAFLSMAEPLYCYAYNQNNSTAIQMLSYNLTTCCQQAALLFMLTLYLNP